MSNSESAPKSGGTAPPPPPPPLPTLGKVHRSSHQMSELPHYLEPKKTFDLGKTMKRAHWNPITPQKISSTSFWANCQEDKLASKDILDGLAEKFEIQPVKKGLQTNNRLNLKKDVKLRVINEKCAQNLLILLRSSLKKYSPEQIKQSILRCDTVILNSDIIEQLLRSLPPIDQIVRLNEIQGTGDKLSESEAFIAVLGGFKDIKIRLESLNFKLCIEEMLQNVKQNISSGIAACEEIKNSNGFGKILEFVLLFGNHMNYGSANGHAYGFELAFLKKLKDTKDRENKQTLLHYLVEVVYEEFPEAQNFCEELQHSKEASRMNMVEVQEIISRMDSSLNDLKSILANSKESQSPDDIFTNVMSDFAVYAYGQLAGVKEMMVMLKTRYNEVAEYFCFDAKKYAIETLFTDVEAFKETFVQALEEIVNARRQQDKNKRMGGSKVARGPLFNKSEIMHKKQQKPFQDKKQPSELEFKHMIREHCRGCEVKLFRLEDTEIASICLDRKRRLDSSNIGVEAPEKKSKSNL